MATSQSARPLSPSFTGDLSDVSSIGAAFSPSRSRTDAAADGDAPTAADRAESILSAFFREVQAAPPAFQRLHLRMFEERLDGFVQHVGVDAALVSAGEWEGLLLHLHTFMHRRGGLTKLQAAIHDEISDTSYRILHRLCNTMHASTPRVREAYGTLLAAVDLTLERVVDPSALTAIPELPTGAAVDLDQAMQDEIDRLEDAARVEAAHEDEALEVPSAALGEMQVAQFQINPHWFTVDCLPTAVAGDLTEVEFQRVEGWFASLEQEANGRYAVTAGTKAAGNVMGCRWLGHKAMHQWSKLFPDGTASLADVLRFLFPTTPAWVVQLRIEGSALVFERKGLEIPTTPQEMLRVPAAEAAMDELELRVRAAGGDRIPPPAEIAMQLRRIFDIADFQRTGTVTIEGLRAVLGDRMRAGSLDIAASVGSAQTMRTAKDGSIPLSFEQFVAAVSRCPAEDVKAVCNEATRVSRWAHEERVSGALKAEVPQIDPKKQPKKLAVNHRVLLRERTSALQAERVERQKLLVGRAMREYQLRRRIDELHAAKATRDAADAAVAAKNVPPVYGPLPEPAANTHPCGIQYAAKVFDLGRFIDAEDTRVSTIRWLRALDGLGLHPDLFLLTHPTWRASQLLPTVHSQPARMYRDAAVAARRPPGGTFWTGDQALQIKTNIPRSSETKYCISVEGYNPGTAAPVFALTVGYASASVPTVGSMEQYGWPDGWDTLTTVRYHEGIRLQQYASHDGFVCVELSARSLSQIGFSVSCSQLSPGFHGTAPFGAQVYHSQARC